jgi:hypothetical protein
MQWLHSPHCLLLSAALPLHRSRHALQHIPNITSTSRTTQPRRSLPRVQHTLASCQQAGGSGEGQRLAGHAERENERQAVERRPDHGLEPESALASTGKGSGWWENGGESGSESVIGIESGALRRARARAREGGIGIVRGRERVIGRARARTRKRGIEIGIGIKKARGRAIGRAIGTERGRGIWRARARAGERAG